MTRAKPDLGSHLRVPEELAKRVGIVQGLHLLTGGRILEVQTLELAVDVVEHLDTPEL